MIFLFQFLPLLLPLNQTFSCHNVQFLLLSVIIINNTVRILDVKIQEGKSSLSIETNEIVADTVHKKNEINQIFLM